MMLYSDINFIHFHFDSSLIIYKNMKALVIHINIKYCLTLLDFEIHTKVRWRYVLFQILSKIL